MCHLLVSLASTSFPSPDLHRCHQHLGCSFPRSDQLEDRPIPFPASQQKRQGEDIYPGIWAKWQQILPELQQYPLHSMLLNPVKKVNIKVHSGTDPEILIGGPQCFSENVK